MGSKKLVQLSCTNWQIKDTFNGAIIAQCRNTPEKHVASNRRISKRHSAKSTLLIIPQRSPISSLLPTLRRQTTLEYI